MKRGMILMTLVIGISSAPGGAIAAGSNQGFLYGTVETTNGKSYTGILRWGHEEAFWGDYFNSAKEELPYLDRQPRGERTRRGRVKVFGTDIPYKWMDDYSSRQFIARFGDIREIEPVGSEGADITMKSGTKLRVEGASNDVGAEISIMDDAIGEVSVPWSRIDSIRFKPTPSGVDPGADRLYGTLRTEDFTFEGYIQWDSDECLSTDVLNGTSDDGKLAIAMGKVVAIAKSGRSRCEVTLRDGRSFVMSGTNDVDESMRGVFVEDARLGRVKVKWGSFERLDFKPAPNSGRSYDDFGPGGPIRGRVTDGDGKTHSGILIFDLDEAETWELLNGSRYDVEYNITFDALRSIEPRGRLSSLVTLRNGADVVLEDSQDVTEKNDGILILVDPKDQGTYIPWDEIEKIDFE